MNYRLVIALVLLLSCSLPLLASGAAPPPLSVLSIIPAQGEPGMTVTLNGTGFTEATVGYLGASRLTTEVVDDKVLTLTIPDLQPGMYALYLRREDGSTSRPYNFAVQPQKPVVTSLAPEGITVCAAGREREVLVNGLNFQRGAQVMFDGGAIGTRFVGPEALGFVTPQLAGGLHQVQVRNPSGAVSGTMALVIDSKPEITSVGIGRDFVSYYELIVRGRNFQQGSALVVDGNRVRTGSPVAGDRENMVFVGCTEMIYQRHPYDSTPKDLRLQVVNPNGEESGVINVSAP